MCVTHFFGQICAIPCLLVFIIFGCSNKKEKITPQSNPSANEVSFASQIRPIITQNCSPCHTSVQNSLNFTVYANAKSKINQILDRVNRQPNEAGFMPKGKEKLSDEEIKLIRAWKDTGLKK